MCACTLPGHARTACLCTCHGVAHTLTLIRATLAKTRAERSH